MIQLIILTYNGSKHIIETIDSYVNYVDRIMIFIDRKTTDHTEDIIKKRKYPNCLVQDISFTDFGNTRNRCVERSSNKLYKWSIFVDDSYVLVGNLDELRLLPSTVNRIGIEVRRDSMSYESIRIYRTAKGAYWKYPIHEYIDGSCDYTMKYCHINDVTSAEHTKRTQDRIHNDLKMLEADDTLRSRFYRANMHFQLYQQGLVSLDRVIELYLYASQFKSDDLENLFVIHCMLGSLYKMRGHYEESIKEYLRASIVYPPRCGECYLIIYLMTEKSYYILKAYQYRYHGATRLPIDKNVYSNDGNFGIIEIQYADWKKKNVMNQLLSHTCTVL